MEKRYVNVPEFLVWKCSNVDMEFCKNLAHTKVDAYLSWKTYLSEYISLRTLTADLSFADSISVCATINIIFVETAKKKKR